MVHTQLNHLTCWLVIYCSLNLMWQTASNINDHNLYTKIGSIITRISHLTKQIKV